MRQKIALDGFWEYSAGYSKPVKRQIPGSYFCAGSCFYRRTVLLPPSDGRKVLLCFEGIAFQGDVTVNGKPVGETMQPYSRYAYDITGLFITGENEIGVRIYDLRASYGPSEGWENYSGIIRETYIEYVPREYIQNIHFHQKLNDTYDMSAVSVETTAEGGDGVQIRLSLNGRNVLAARSDAGNKTVNTEIRFPALWDPENPVLYDLYVDLLSGNNVVDTVSEKIGIKDFSIKGNMFMLNGKPCFLKGVCRHDMWGEQGFTLTDCQIDRDLQMIKALGANFIRLVHYPHDRRVIEAADRIGLLVSEEPGLWWSDMNNPEVTKGALEVLRRTILRDRSRVSVAFWLAFNECIFTEQFLEDTINLVRKMDPYRVVSGANCMNLKMTKEQFSRYNWDFYTFHPYGALPGLVTAGYGADEPHKTIDDVVSFLCDKPLVFTEWGGWYVHDNPALYKLFNRKMASYADERPDGLRLAGMAYWCWNDIYELNRGGDACTDGVLVEGLVDIHRNKRVNYYTQSDCFHDFGSLSPCYRGEAEIYGFDLPAVKQTNVDIYAGQDLAANEKNFYAALENAKVNNGFFQHKKIRLLERGPILPYEIRNIGALQTALKPCVPLIAGPSDLHINVNNISGDTIYLIGMTALCDAYPISGKIGDIYADLVIYYTDQSTQEIKLRNGVELSTVFMTYGSSRIDNYAAEARRAIIFNYDKNWERYCINILSLRLTEGKYVQSISIKPKPGGFPILLYGITLTGDD